MPKSLQILLRDARSAIEAAVRADLAQNGFGDVTPAHSALLRNIGDDGARPSELAAHAGVTRQAITKLVDELERLDLVRRDPDPDDGRGVIVRYTDRGRAGVAIARRRCSRSNAATPRRSAPTAGPRCAQPSRPYSVTTLTRTRACLPPQTLSNRERLDHNKHARPMSKRSGSGSAGQRCFSRVDRARRADRVSADVVRPRTALSVPTRQRRPGGSYPGRPIEQKRCPTPG